MSTFPAVVRLTVAPVGVVPACFAAADAHAAGVFHCPDVSHQDEPRGKGGKQVARTSREGEVRVRKNCG